MILVMESTGTNKKLNTTTLVLVVMAVLITLLILINRIAQDNEEKEKISGWIGTCSERTAFSYGDYEAYYTKNDDVYRGVGLYPSDSEFSYISLDDVYEILAPYMGKEIFREVLLNKLEKLEQEGDIAGFLNTVETMEYLGYYNETIKEKVIELYEKKENELFSSTDSIFDNIDSICGFIRLEYYFDDRNAVVNKLKEHATGSTVVTKNGRGGYYDNLKGDYSNSSSVEDPLGLGGGVGTYSVSESYGFYGDFLRMNSSKHWYGTDSSDVNNTSSSAFFFRGQHCDKEIAQIIIESTGTTYYISNEESDEFYFFAFNDENLMAVATNSHSKSNGMTYLLYHTDYVEREYVRCSWY